RGPRLGAHHAPPGRPAPHGRVLPRAAGTEVGGRRRPQRGRLRENSPRLPATAAFTIRSLRSCVSSILRRRAVSFESTFPKREDRTVSRSARRASLSPFLTPSLSPSLSPFSRPLRSQS